LDGSDEDKTGACSGSSDGGWAGVPHEAATTTTPSSLARFQCPQQRSLTLPPSRLNDGICDCCDGADEYSLTKCVDICDKVLASERAARMKVEADFIIGSKKRLDELNEYDRAVNESKVEMEKLTGHVIPNLESDIAKLDGRIRNVKLAYATERFDAARKVQESLSNIWGVTSLEELSSFIISACQLAAESLILNESKRRTVNQKTCIPLRLAGLDIGILWENEDFGEFSASVRYLDKDDEKSMEEFATLLDENSGDDGFVFGKDGSVKHVSSKQGNSRRRHNHRHRHSDDDEDDNDSDDDPDYDSEDNDYTFESDDDDDYYLHHDPSENDEEEEHDRQIDHLGKDDNGKSEHSSLETTESKDLTDVKSGRSRGEMVKDAVRSNMLFASRANFKARAKELMDRIDSIRKDNGTRGDGTEEDKDESGKEEVDATTRENRDGAPQVDPMAIQMLSGTISRRLRSLERGEMHATSAKILLDALLSSLSSPSPSSLSDADKDDGGGGGVGVGVGVADVEANRRVLTNLAIGTVYHGRLSAASVAEIYYAAIPELWGEGGSGPIETCGSGGGGSGDSAYYATMCLPKTVSRLGVSIPPAAILKAAEALCEERAALATTCAGEGEGGMSSGTTTTAEREDDIPASIPDGYYGYYPPVALGAGDGDDIFVEHFSPLDKLEPSRTKTLALEAEKTGILEELDGAQTKLRDLEEKVGGKDVLKFGTDGELYGIRDNCFKVESGKYEYELCIFGKATQREKGQKGGGTNLGRWAGMKTDGSTGLRVMTWERGTKCWNGPMRSATATVTCGAETKVLTADEPRTCEYEMSMESHIACDDMFRVSQGL